MSAMPLNTSPLPDDEQLISCESCLKSAPLSEASSREAEEYVAYFCGLDCYNLWIHQKPDITFED